LKAAQWMGNTGNSGLPTSLLLIMENYVGKAIPMQKSDIAFAVKFNDTDKNRGHHTLLQCDESNRRFSMGYTGTQNGLQNRCEHREQTLLLQYVFEQKRRSR
jgi:hypothetical protein